MMTTPENPTLQAKFINAVNSVISGQTDELRRLLAEHPSLISERSISPHHAMLIHYVSANGVEDELQRSPANIVEIATILLDAGADPNALADTYGGGIDQTPLVLLVTSAPPAKAGVQADLAVALVNGGAAVEGLSNDGAPLANALRAGRHTTAKALVSVGAQVDNLLFAAGLGDLDKLSSFFQSNGTLTDDAQYRRGPDFHQISTPELLALALAFACNNEQYDAADFLLKNGADINSQCAGLTFGVACTPLHRAAFRGKIETVRYLLSKGADTGIQDTQYNDTPAGWARHAGNAEIAALLEATVK